MENFCATLQVTLEDARVGRGAKSGPTPAARETPQSFAQHSIVSLVRVSHFSPSHHS